MVLGYPGRSLFVVVFLTLRAVFVYGVENNLHSSSSSAKYSNGPESKLVECQLNDEVCFKDRIGYEAISQLHSQIDDDQDGGLNREESDEFIRDDLKHEGTKVDNFHGNDDFITVQDLWQMWIKSDVYNWTTDDVIMWLEDHVELSQYSSSFRSLSIDGRVLPRIASNYQSLIGTIGIKNPVHKQKLAVKATDVVLFGPPKSKHSVLKDVILVLSLALSVGGCYFAYVQHKRAQSHVQKLMKDLSSLQNSEDTLSQMQQQLDEAQQAQRVVVDDKEALEKKLREEIINAKSEAERLRHQRETKEEEFSKLRLAEEELIQVRLALFEAERQLEERHQAPFGNLQQWLQLTYEVETKYFEEKKQSAEKQLQGAKEMCEKIRRQKGKFLGALRVAHSATLDDTDNKILSVRTALEDIKVELHERTQRWKQIENLCGFNVMTNPGIPFLDSFLRGSAHGAAEINLNTGRSQSNFSSLDSADDDASSGIFARRMVGSCEKVIPSLMRAGMKLSLVGINACAPLHGMAVVNHCDRKGLSVMGSTGSLLQSAASTHRLMGSKEHSSEFGSTERLEASNRAVIFELGPPSNGSDGRQAMVSSRSEPVQLAPRKVGSLATILSPESKDSEMSARSENDQPNKKSASALYVGKQKSA